MSVMAGTPKEKPKKKQPERKCVGCGERKTKNELVRVLRTPEGEICIDRTGKKSGRGAYLCRDNPDCWEKAYKRKALERSLGMEITAEAKEKIFAELREMSHEQH